jgi:Fis family transcriptional regulator
MPAKKNYGSARRADRSPDRATGRALSLRMISPASATSRSDAPSRSAPPPRGESASRAAPAARGEAASPDCVPAQLPLPLPLRDHAHRALSDYFANLDGHRPAHLYDLVMREVEEPLFRAVLDHCAGNQSRAATMLGINRGTLRKKLRELGLAS